jgi:hypothetical protein
MKEINFKSLLITVWADHLVHSCSEVQPNAWHLLAILATIAGIISKRHQLERGR